MSGHPTPGADGAANCPPAAPGTTPAEPLPRFGELIRDAERLGAQLLHVLRRPVDPATEPTATAWPSLSADILVHRVLLAEAVVNVEYALSKIAQAGSLPSPPAGSAVRAVRP